MSRPLRVFLVVLSALAATTVIASLTDGALAYALTGVTLFLIVAVGTPLALASARPRSDAELADRKAKHLRGAPA